MKKILLSMLCVFIMFSAAACAKQMSGRAAWDEFYSALEITASLEYYSLKTVKTDKGSTKEGRLVLSSDEEGHTVAYREDGAVRSWWIDGIAYTEGAAEKTKKAQSINSFLDISEEPVLWSYDMVENVKMNGKTITFETHSAVHNKITVTAVTDDIFLSEISVFAETQSGGTTLTYKYENLGQKPAIKLPEDLSAFIWEV